MPQWVRDQTDASAQRNMERLHRVEHLYRALDECLKTAAIDYLALKGLSHCPEFGTAAADRVQYDIDLYIPQQHVYAAQACR